jgi:hypothetical protein
LRGEVSEDPFITNLRHYAALASMGFALLAVLGILAGGVTLWHLVATTLCLVGGLMAVGVHLASSLRSSRYFSLAASLCTALGIIGLVLANKLVDS